MKHLAWLASPLAMVVCAALSACSGDDPHSGHHDTADGGPPTGSEIPHRMFVVGDGKLKAFDLETGVQHPGEVTNVTRLVDLMATDDGFLLGNLTDDNTVLVVDGRTMLEEARIPSSTTGGTRPVHGYLTPKYEGQQFWLVLSDGSGEPVQNRATLVDVTPGSATRFQALGEAELGLGHHKASFSRTKRRVSVSNISDCNVVLQVLDFTDPTDIKELARSSAAQLGFTTCAEGNTPSAHGTATGANGKAYHNLTGPGDMVEIDMDADPPTFRMIPTRAIGGGGYTTHGFGEWVYTLHAEPREGNGGPSCQIGQLTVLSTKAAEGTVAAEIPVFYEGPDCTRALVGTDEESAYPGHVLVDATHRQLFVTPAGGFGNASARVRRSLVFDASNPSQPVQVASISVGAGTGHMADALTGNDRYVLVVGTVDGTVTVIDAATRQVVRTIDVGPNPTQVATWGSAEGPSHQTGPLD